MNLPPLPVRAAVFPRIVLPEVHGMGPNTMVMKEWDMFDAEQMRAYGESCARMAREEERARIESSEVVQFLYGAGELDGVGYSEVPTGKPRYWWRSILRATIKG